MQKPRGRSAHFGNLQSLQSVSVWVHVHVCVTQQAAGQRVIKGQDICTTGKDGPWDFTAANYVLLSISFFSQSHESFCSPRSLHLASKLSFYQTVRRPVHFRAAMCIHHLPFISVPSTSWNAAEVFAYPFCPLLWAPYFTFPSNHFYFLLAPTGSFGGQEKWQLSTDQGITSGHLPLLKLPFPCLVAGVLLLYGQLQFVPSSVCGCCPCNNESIFLPNA